MEHINSSSSVGVNDVHNLTFGAEPHLALLPAEDHGTDDDVVIKQPCDTTVGWKEFKVCKAAKGQLDQTNSGRWKRLWYLCRSENLYAENIMWQMEVQPLKEAEGNVKTVLT